MIKVYIAGPYTIGDPARNVRAQIDCAHDLLERGYNPHIPLLNHYVHIVHPRAYYEWLSVDLEWLLLCDCVLRLKGRSEGADYEVKIAREHHIPVFFDIETLSKEMGGGSDRQGKDHIPEKAGV